MEPLDTSISRMSRSVAGRVGTGPDIGSILIQCKTDVNGVVPVPSSLESALLAPVPQDPRLSGGYISRISCLTEPNPYHPGGLGPATALEKLPHGHAEGSAIAVIWPSRSPAK
jgi:hypothetical protein